MTLNDVVIIQLHTYYTNTIVSKKLGYNFRSHSIIRNKKWHIDKIHHIQHRTLWQAMLA